MRPHTFARASRLSGQRAFAAVYEHRTRRSAGPLTVYARPNALAFSRLGLSISRRTGSAVRRNRFKRLIREAFRLTRADLPQGYDWIVVIRAHEPVKMQEYQEKLRRLMGDRQ